jgi:hypothetical protein
MPLMTPGTQGALIVSTLVRKSLAAAGLAAIVAAGAGAVPAYAGGPGQVYVYGNTLSQCRTNLDKTVTLYKHYGYTVTGVHGCRKAGDGVRYFGDFVAN